MSLINQGNTLAMLENQLKQSEAQGAAVRMMFEEMKQMHENIQEMKLDVSEKFEECQIMVQEVRDSVTLIDAECDQMQAVVRLRSNELTKHRFKDSDMKFKEMVGKYRRTIWSKLKEQFSVAKYSHLRRIDFEDAIEFVQKFQPEDYM
ncbi:MULTISPECIES: ORF6C domain-containing protein [unclassified Paenibacillus]|uniref:ORF6C domain-containing protein n=1 Tax=unclassified Paenibacillus TaxID=185978 RepID=UPI00096F6F05|nr:ORF6C domain-containing protein [Paenibacillus sp. FSL H8-0259]OMF30915.1 ABC transporter permease [Paenibacillus sp. FSL H8-0259]